MKIGKYIGFVSTKWRNYGGELTRLDLRWKQHSCQWAGKPSWLPDLNPWKEPAEFVAGSIKDAFEEGQPFIFESVLTPYVKRNLYSKWLEGRDIRWAAGWPPDDY